MNRTKSFQNIFGFGGAVTDATGYNVFKLSDSSIKNFLDSYFHENGEFLNFN